MKRVNFSIIKTFNNYSGILIVAMRPLKKKIETKYKLPLLNWVALPPTKINGTIFSEIDDDNVHKVVDFTEFEETFKLKSQAESLPKQASKDGKNLCVV